MKRVLDWAMRLVSIVAILGSVMGIFFLSTIEGNGSDWTAILSLLVIAILFLYCSYKFAVHHRYLSYLGVALLHIGFAVAGLFDGSSDLSNLVLYSLILILVLVPLALYDLVIYLTNKKKGNNDK